MKKLLFILILNSGFGQIIWETEVVDSSTAPQSYDYRFNSLALDTSEIPHIAYNCGSVLTCASRNDSCWQEEVVESGLFYYGHSLVFDANNIPHISYYRRDDAIGRTYVCHAWREPDRWQTEEVDSIAGPIGSFFKDFKTSIDIDASSLPGIAYNAWNIEDSVYYIKYAHYNGTIWDSSVVEYDSIYANIQAWPTDFGPSLKFSSKNIPYIAFQQRYQDFDTLKIAHYNDTSNCWLKDVIYTFDAGSPISLELNSQDYPNVAHCLAGWLYFTWWDGMFWHLEDCGISLGWFDIDLDLELDSLSNPHIVYIQDMFLLPGYCYKKDTTWYKCGSIEPDSEAITSGVSFSLDNYDRPHVSYRFWIPSYIYRIKYARGTFVGIEEERVAEPQMPLLEVFPNPFRERIEIRLKTMDAQLMTKDISLKIYDIGGRVIKDISPTTYSTLPTVITWKGTDCVGKRVPEGIYFIHLNAGNKNTTKKIILLK